MSLVDLQDVKPRSAVDALRRQFRYDAWANRETLRSIEAAGATAPERVREVMAHILAAEWLWLQRMGFGKQVAVWPGLPLDKCAAELEQLAPAWQAFLNSQDAAALAANIEYTNTKGERWSNTREDIMMHVLMHSAYHRGQIASALRASGANPAYTDFIEAVRRGNCES